MMPLVTGRLKIGAVQKVAATRNRSFRRVTSLILAPVRKVVLLNWPDLEG